MENKIYTQAELRRENILTDEYALNLEPGDYLARLDLKAETPRRNDCLRLFFTFEDGRKVLSTVHWWNRYLAFYDIPTGTQLHLTYSRTAQNAVYLTAAEIVELPVPEETVVSYQATNCGDTIPLVRGNP